MIKKFWLFRTESVPSSPNNEDKEVELYTSELKPHKDLRGKGALEAVKSDSSLSTKTAMAVAELMAQNALAVSRGDFFLVAYKGEKYVDIAEITEPYSYIDGKHTFKGKVLRRLMRTELDTVIRNNVLRKPRIIAEIDDVSSLLCNYELNEVEYTIPLRPNYSVSFKLPADFTKAEAYRLAEIFKNSWVDEGNIK